MKKPKITGRQFAFLSDTAEGFARARDYRTVVRLQNLGLIEFREMRIGQFIGGKYFPTDAGLAVLAAAK